MRKPSILVVGSSNLDLVMQLERLPEPGETVTNGQFSQAFGGKGANQAVAAARSDGSVTLLTALGRDASGQAMRANFVKEGIQMDHAVEDSENPSGCALIMVDQQGQNCIAVAPGANNSLVADSVESFFSEGQTIDLVILQMEIPTRTVARTLELASHQGIPTMMNYAPVKDLSVSISSRMSILVVNESEAGALTESHVADLESAKFTARLFREKGPKMVLITLGKGGVWIDSESYTGHVPAFEVSAVDATAAGDTFCGAFGVMIAEGKSVVDAAVYASAASAISVTRLGAQPSIPFREEVEAFLKGR